MSFRASGCAVRWWWLSPPSYVLSPCPPAVGYPALHRCWSRCQQGGLAWWGGAGRSGVGKPRGGGGWEDIPELEICRVTSDR